MKLLNRVLFLSFLFMTLSACNDNDDLLDELGQEILITDDVDCCSAEEALAVFNFLHTLKEVPSLSQTVADKFTLHVYTTTGTLHSGYNDLYFAVTKNVSNNYVKDIEITSFTPLMTMSSGMVHSTPLSRTIKLFDYGVLAVRHGWVSFVMNTSANGSWNVDFDVRAVSSTEHVSLPVTVDALADGQKWITQFKVGDQAYHISLVNPLDWKVGSNNVSAYITEVSSDKKNPYNPTSQRFSVAITPTMPDMGYHSAPEGKSLVSDGTGLYKGVVNFTMSGPWRLHLSVYDADGNLVAGGDDADHGFSSLSLDVIL